MDSDAHQWTPTHPGEITLDLLKYMPKKSPSFRLMYIFRWGPGGLTIVTELTPPLK